MAYELTTYEVTIPEVNYFEKYLTVYELEVLHGMLKDYLKKYPDAPARYHAIDAKVESLLSGKGKIKI